MFRSVDSSSIEAIRYDAEPRILEIKFQNTAIYRYFEVPKEEYEAFANAQSKGRFFVHVIKGIYPFEKLR